VVGYPHEVLGAVEQASLRPGVGVAITGPIDADEIQASLTKPLRVVEAWGESSPRSWRAVSDEYRSPFGIAPGGVSDGSPVVELEAMIVGGGT
jgi:hypothetical protein